MDDKGYIKKRGLRLCTNSYSLSNVKYLILLQENKLNLINLSAVSAGGINQYMIYIYKRNLPILLPIVEAYIHPIFFI